MIENLSIDHSNENNDLSCADGANGPYNVTCALRIMKLSGSLSKAICDQTLAPPRLEARNIIVNGRSSSVRLSQLMWQALLEVANWEGLSVDDLCTAVANNRHPAASVTSAIRAFVAMYYRAMTADAGRLVSAHGEKISPESMHHFADLGQMITVDGGGSR